MSYDRQARKTEQLQYRIDKLEWELIALQKRVDAIEAVHIANTEAGEDLAKAGPVGRLLRRL